MRNRPSKHRILIFGASGFLGNALYRELCPYFKTFGTYCRDNPELEGNQHFFQFKLEQDDAVEIIEAVKPSIIISALRGDFAAQITTHRHMTDYVKSAKCKIIFLSSANVFDAYSKYPSYENDTTLSNSVYGHFKIKIENTLMKLPKRKVAILRLPMVFGSGSPRIREIKAQLENEDFIEVFPNLIMNVTTDSKVTQQIHYIINRGKWGVFHLGSSDLVHHDDFFREMVDLIGGKNVGYLLIQDCPGNRCQRS